MAKKHYHRSGGGKGKVNVAAIVISVILVLAIAAAITIGALTDWYRDFSIFGKPNEGTQTEQPNEGGGSEPSSSLPGYEPTGGNNVRVEVHNSDNLLLAPMAIPAAYYDAYGVAENAEGALVVTATVLPDGATNKAVSGSLAWLNAESSWAAGKDVSNYITLSHDSNSATFVLTCLQPFAEQAILTVQSASNAGSRATATVDFMEHLIAQKLALGEQELTDGYEIVGGGSITFALKTYKTIGSIANNNLPTVTALSMEINDTIDYYLRDSGVPAILTDILGFEEWRTMNIQLNQCYDIADLVRSNVTAIIAKFNDTQRAALCDQFGVTDGALNTYMTNEATAMFLAVFNDYATAEVGNLFNITATLSNHETISVGVRLSGVTVPVTAVAVDNSSLVFNLPSEPCTDSHAITSYTASNGDNVVYCETCGLQLWRGNEGETLTFTDEDYEAYTKLYSACFVLIPEGNLPFCDYYTVIPDDEVAGEPEELIYVFEYVSNRKTPITLNFVAVNEDGFVSVYSADCVLNCQCNLLTVVYDNIPVATFNLCDREAYYTDADFEEGYEFSAPITGGVICGLRSRMR